MKVVFEHIQTENQQSIVYRKIELPSFDAPYHFHPEYELTYIIKGRGTRYVGTSIEHFEPGELVLIAPNVPHCWINEPQEGEEMVKAMVIQFHPNVLNKSVYMLPEFKNLMAYLDQVDNCLIFKNHQLADNLSGFEKQTPPRNFLQLLSILIELKTIPSYSLGNQYTTHLKAHERFHEVFSYIIENFKQPIKLEVVAKIAGLSPTSFCRYFKKYTGQTLFDIVRKHRLQAASQLLLNTDKRINEIAYESGFDDIPYFNRAFKKWKGVSPKTYRKTMDKSSERFTS